MKFCFPAICILVLGCSACSGSDSGSANSETITDGIVDFTENGHAPRNTGHIDSLANEADFLSAGEGVGVLVAYNDIICQAREGGKSKLMYETMRKFVDLYNIVSHNHRSEFIDATDKVLRNQGPDLRNLVTEYRDRLADYDDASGMISFAPKAEETPADSTAKAATDSVAAPSQAPEKAETVEFTDFF